VGSRKLRGGKKKKGWITTLKLRVRSLLKASREGKENWGLVQFEMKDPGSLISGREKIAAFKCTSTITGRGTGTKRGGPGDESNGDGRLCTSWGSGGGGGGGGAGGQKAGVWESEFPKKGKKFTIRGFTKKKKTFRRDSVLVRNGEKNTGVEHAHIGFLSYWVRKKKGPGMGGGGRTKKKKH